MSILRSQLIRFVIIGLASTGLYFGLLFVSLKFVSSIVLVTAFCYALSMVFNFLAQGLFTFQMWRVTLSHLRRYIVLHLCALSINSLAMAALVNGLGIKVFIAQVFVTGAITLGTFSVSKLWVYR